MYGVPSTLDLTFLHGAELVQVCLGAHQVQFHFQPLGSISVEGEWELLDAAGQQLDRSHPGTERPPYLLHRLLGKRVVGSQVVAPHSIALRFEGGASLRVFDSSREYESFSIEPGGVVA